MCTATEVLHIPSPGIPWLFSFSIRHYNWESIYLSLFHFCVQPSNYCHLATKSKSQTYNNYRPSYFGLQFQLAL